MRVAFDTSVLVAGLVSSHPHHQRARCWLMAVRRGEIEGVTCAHALAETWSTLTAMPLKPSVSGHQASRLVAGATESIEVVDLSSSDYWESMSMVAACGARSGAIYDALHYVAAARRDSDIMLTFNEADFARFQVAGAPAVVVPPDPPALI